jgi:hypothetical protein
MPLNERREEFNMHFGLSLMIFDGRWRACWSPFLVCGVQLFGGKLCFSPIAHHSAEK